MDKRGCSESTDDYFHQQLFQLQEVDVWQIGPMNDDFQALQDELRYMFLEYITDADRILLNNISTRDLQHMADERQKALATIIVRQGINEAQHCFAEARQNRLRDEHAMWQAVLARHNQFRRAHERVWPNWKFTPRQWKYNLRRRSVVKPICWQNEPRCD